MTRSVLSVLINRHALILSVVTFRPGSMNDEILRAVIVRGELFC